MYLLTYVPLQRVHISLDRLHEFLDITLHHFRCETQLSNRYPHNSNLLSELTATYHRLQRCLNVANDSPHLRAGHQALWSKDAPQVCLVQLLQRAKMAYAPIKLHLSFSYLIEDFLFADERCAPGNRIGGGLRAWLSDDTNS